MPTLGNTPRPAYVYDTETDTWVPVGVGAHTHSDIPNTLVDAKGDLITATADNVPARLAKGADGTVLVADSSTSTGLAWQPYAAPFVAGKNKVINGDMNVWQRGASFLGGGTNSFVGYTADRWYANLANVTRGSFIPGELPVAEGSQYFLKAFNATGMGSGAFDRMDYRIEDVRTLAGQTVTVSFYTRKPTAKNGLLAGAIVQNFGSGGSANVTAGGISAPAYSGTSWVRSVTTFTMPSLAGKTIGTNSYIEIQLYGNMGGTPNFEYDIWGLQLEAGPIATPFTTATGTIQGELAACQRYFQALSWGPTYNTAIHSGHFWSSTKSLGTVHLKTTMRSNPAVSISSPSHVTVYSANATYSVSSIGVDATTPASFDIEFVTSSAGTAGYGTFNRITNSSGYLWISAEL
jgi:hypothetical protein